MGDWESSTDAELVAAVAGSDVGALRELYERHATWLSIRLSRRCSEPGLVASVLVAVVIGLFVVPLPRGFQPLQVADAWSNATLVWGVVAVVSAGVLVRASRA